MKAALLLLVLCAACDCGDASYRSHTPTDAAPIDASDAGACDGGP